MIYDSSGGPTMYYTQYYANGAYTQPQFWAPPRSVTARSKARRRVPHPDLRAGRGEHGHYWLIDR
jgi:hypothetical protein